MYRIWWESPKERDHLEDKGIDGRMGSEWILGGLAEGYRWALVNTVMKCGFWHHIVTLVS
jgi:hypothetical protein